MYLHFLITINSARKSILITNPYFIPDDVMTDALIKAVARGVRVVVLTPGEIDSQLTYTASRSHYGRLLSGGAQIFEYQAALMHAKTMVVDGIWATIGSTKYGDLCNVAASGESCAVRKTPPPVFLSSRKI